jgi:trehalose 6-phosphate phosphatase
MRFSYVPSVTRNAAPAPSRDWCLFLDVDGTLLDLADTPLAVIVGEELKILLRKVAVCLNGAIALVSGRDIGALDKLFAPLKLPAAGLHGIERRPASGDVRGASYLDERLQSARDSLSAFVASHPGTLFEDKARTLAVHYRLAPQAEQDVRRAVSAAARDLRPDYHVQEGKMVLEIKPRAFTKATAIEEFMCEPPFSGRTPVVVGDDLTDLAGFRAVEARGGISIAVGNRIRGQWRLDNPSAVRRWLASIAALGQEPV